MVIHGWNVFRGGNRWNARNILIIFLPDLFFPWKSQRIIRRNRNSPRESNSFFIESKKLPQKKRSNFEVHRTELAHDLICNARCSIGKSYQISSEWNVGNASKPITRDSGESWSRHSSRYKRASTVTSLKFDGMFTPSYRWFIALAFKPIKQNVRTQRFIHRSMLLRGKKS